MLPSFRSRARATLLVAVAASVWRAVCPARPGRAEARERRRRRPGPARRGWPRGRRRSRARRESRPGPQNRPVVTGTGSISGVVAARRRRTGVRHAQVTLAGTELRGLARRTDDQGQFTFSALPAGEFTLSVTKPGYVTMAYGAKKPGRQGTPIQLTDGQETRQPQSDPAQGQRDHRLRGGRPRRGCARHAGHRLSVRDAQTARRGWQQAGRDQTDDRGLYRIFQLHAGRLLVSAAPRNRGRATSRQQMQAQSRRSRSRSRRPAAGRVAQRAGRGPRRARRPGRSANLAGTADGRGQASTGRPACSSCSQLQQQTGGQNAAYAPVYFPGTTDAGVAGSVTIGVAEERSGIDLQLQLVPTATVEGTVVSPDGTVPVQGRRSRCRSTRRAGHAEPAWARQQLDARIAAERHVLLPERDAGVVPGDGARPGLGGAGRDADRAKRAGRGGARRPRGLRGGRGGRGGGRGAITQVPVGGSRRHGGRPARQRT